MKLLILILFACACYGQGDYRALAKEAWTYYQEKNYQKSAETYLKALALVDESKSDESILTMRFNTACAFALAGNRDKSFLQLAILSKDENYTNLNQLNTDSDLKSLHADPRWEKIAKQVSDNYEKVKPVSKEELEKIYTAYKAAQDQLFSANGSQAAVDKLYEFYTDDFIYNHPAYGGNYTRKHLYENTVKFMKAGRYMNSRKRETLNIIYGLNAICIEQRYEGEDKTTMTLFKFRKDKIYYIEEYW